MKKRFFKILLIVFVAQNVFGQKPFITNLTIADGLPTNRSNCVLQDKNGFMWFGTDAGAIRYDGTSFKRFTTKDGLSSNTIFRMKEDLEGRIWFLNNDGTVNYYANNQIYNESNAPFLGEIKTNFFYHNLFQDTDSTIYFYNGAGEVYVVKGNQYIDYTSSDQEGTVIFNINKASNNHLLLWESNRIVEKGSTDTEVGVHPLDFSISSAIPLSNGFTYVTDLSGNVHLFRDTKLIVRDYIKTDSKLVNDILLDNDYLWISTFDNGIYCYKDDRLILHESLDKIQNLVIDKQNNIWTCSNTYGVFKISNDILRYQNIGSEKFDNKGIRDIAPSSNGDYLWLTNGKSLYALFDGEVFDRKVTLEDNILDNIYHLKNDNLLMNGTNTPLYIIENINVNNKEHTITYDEMKSTPYHIRKFVVDSTESYAHIYLNDDLSVIELNNNYRRQTSGINAWGRIRNIDYNHKNNLLLNGEFNCIITNGQAWIDSTYAEFDGKRISSIVTLNNKTEVLYIEDKGKNELILNNDGHKYLLIDDLDDQIDLKIRNKFYYDNTLFLFSVKTVYFINNPLAILKGESAELNRLNLEFNNINDLYCQKEILYVASDDGLTMIPVKECVNATTTPTKPYFSNVSLNDEIVDLTKGKITYKNKDRLNIEFSSLNFSSSPTNYAYMLEGVNKEWITGTEKQVVYLNLKPGTYNFKLKSRKNMEAYSEVIELPVVVVPTFFQYLATKIAIVLSLLFLGFLMIRSYYRRQLAIREKDNQLVTLENRALQSMMNPHFIFNSLGSIQKFLLQNKAEEAGTYLSRFARLIRQTMNSIKSNSVLLDDEVDRLRNYIELEQFRMENRFDYKIILDERLEEDDYYIPSMIVQPFVENAIWHGISQLEGDGRITVRFYYLDERSIKIVIEDNGIGFEKSKTFSKSKNHLNMASNLTNKRIQLIGDKYHVKTRLSCEELLPGAPNPGAKITLIVPIVE
ncbi:MAG TPA: histidine kinase [Draconibacterium sp.]|nr:histidine kinase [Draconibacterium sp.]